jgi:O-acetylhomoserine (thiol)-lyase
MTDAAELKTTGLTPDKVRLSVGSESLDGILYDLDQALERSVKLE